MRNKILMIAAVAFVCGMVLLGVSLGMVRFNFQMFSTGEKFTEHTYTCSSDVQELTVSEDSTGMIVKTGNVDKINVHYYEREGETYTIDEKSSRLNIVKNRKFVWRFMDIVLEEHELEVVIPEDFNGKVKIASEDGSVRVMDLCATDTEISNKSGSIRLDNLQTGKLLVSNCDGSIRIKDVIAAGKVEVSNKSGSTSLDDIQCQDLAASNRDGSITLNKTTAKNEIQVTDKSGAISVENLDAGNSIQITNEDGSIRGTIVGAKEDFLTSVSVKDGSNSLDNTISGDKRLLVSNDDGGVFLKFTK